jgi:hypothetical protein
MIKKNFNQSLQIFERILWKSKVKINKFDYVRNFKLSNKLKLKKVSKMNYKKKNFLFNNSFYKKYKLLNFKFFFKEKKILRKNFNNFLDLLIWVIFVDLDYKKDNDIILIKKNFFKSKSLLRLKKKKRFKLLKNIVIRWKKSKKNYKFLKKRLQRYKNFKTENIFKLLKFFFDLSILKYEELIKFLYYNRSFRNYVKFKNINKFLNLILLKIKVLKLYITWWKKIYLNKKFINNFEFKFKEINDLSKKKILLKKKRKVMYRLNSLKKLSYFFFDQKKNNPLKKIKYLSYINQRKNLKKNKKYKKLINQKIIFFKKIYKLPKLNNLNYKNYKNLRLFYKLKSKKKYIYKLKKKKKKFLRKIKYHFKNILKKKKNKLIQFSDNQVKQRFFFYDFFFTKFDSNIFLLKQNTFLNILWKKKINKTFLRFRLSEHIFLLLNNIQNKYVLEKKIYFILNFYKIIYLLKKNLLFLKNKLLKKHKNYFILKRKKNLINYKNWKNLLKKEYLYHKFKLKKKKLLILKKYRNLLKYFNKFLYFFSKRININILNIIKKYSPFVYLSFIINVTIDKKKYFSLVSMNNYFMQKVTNSFLTSWFINDRVFNYINILDTKFNKDIYWNFLSPIKNWAKKKNLNSLLMLPCLKKGVNLNYTYFINKKLKKNKKINNNILNFIYISLFFIRELIKNKLNLFFIIKYLYKIKQQITNNNFNMNFKNIIIILKFNIILNLLKIINKKLNLLIKFNNILQKYLLILKKNYLLNLIYFLNTYLFKQRSFFLGLNIKKNFLLIFYQKMINLFTNFKLNFINNKIKKNLILYNYLFFYNNLKKNKYIFKKFFLNVYHNYYTTFIQKNKKKDKRCVLHLIERPSNNFLVLSLFKKRRVIGHTSAGQAFNRAYTNSKRRKKGTRALTKIIYKKLRLRARKYSLKEVFIKANVYWNFRVKLLTKYWVLRYKLGVSQFRGVKVGLNMPFHKGLRQYKKKRK